MMEKILKRKVTRKQFLIWVGTLVITFIGINRIFEMLNEPATKKSDKSKITFYGNSVYGGVKKG